MKITKEYLRTVIKEELERMDEVNWIGRAGQAVGNVAGSAGKKIGKVGSAIAKGTRVALGSNENIGIKEFPRIKNNVTQIVNLLEDVLSGENDEEVKNTFDSIYKYGKMLSILLDKIRDQAKNSGVLTEGFSFKNFGNNVSKGLSGLRQKIGGQSDSEFSTNLLNKINSLSEFITQVMNLYVEVARGKDLLKINFIKRYSAIKQEGKNLLSIL